MYGLQTPLSASSFCNETILWCYLRSTTGVIDEQPVYVLSIMFDGAQVAGPSYQ